MQDLDCRNFVSTFLHWNVSLHAMSVSPKTLWGLVPFPFDGQTVDLQEKFCKLHMFCQIKKTAMTEIYSGIGAQPGLKNSF